MTESERRQFLKVVWGHRLYGPTDVRWSDGEVAYVERGGYASETSGAVTVGPDFENAAVACGESMLYGGVRVDGMASTWRTEGDMSSTAYDSVLFHVVGERDRVLFRKGREDRTLILQASSVLERMYEEMLAESSHGSEGCLSFFGRLAGGE